ncbi:BICD family-like cargo adapter 2 isoform X2 [Arvicanthis niloticus]|uniref:BICD family-like cargo adapter 2 isoform X2 n=1 Tax=Arvicanthis niloticus TaxID=61156 RepID=UPI00402B7F59
MDSPGGPSFPSGLLSGGASPSGDEGFFPFVLERRDSFLGGGPGPEEPEDLALQLQQKEKDLLLAAELGKMLLERNEELRRQLETLNAQHLEQEEASRTEQELQRELDTLRGQCQTQTLAGAELRARLESLQAENQMLQDRRQDLEAQIRGLRDEVDKGQGRLQSTHEELLLLRRERKEHQLELERARFEAGEALSTLRRLQRRVSELEEESRLQDAEISGASLQTELAHSLDSDQDQDQQVNECGDSQTILSPEIQEASSPQPSIQEEILEPPKKRASLSPVEILEEKEAEVARLQDEITLHRTELQTLRDELQRQKELRAQDNPEEALSCALSDRDEAVNKALKLSLELSRVSLERDSVSRELMRAIRQKVALTQELEAWQDDMQVVIGQQLRSQRQKELSEAAAASRRAKTRFSLRLGSGQSGGFLSNLFRRT